MWWSSATAARACLFTGLICVLVWAVVQHSMGSAQSGTKAAAPQQQGGGSGGGTDGESGAGAAEKLGAGLLLT